MARSMVGLLLVAVGAAVPVLLAAAHGVAVIGLAISATIASGGVYALQILSEKSLKRHGSSCRNYLT